MRRAEEAFDRIDLFCSNAGIATKGGAEASDADWQRNWQVNLMSHVYAARAVLPGMLKRGRGYLLNTASAAGLLTEMGSAPYSVTKHAAVAFAEWLSIQHRDAGSACRACVRWEYRPTCCRPRIRTSPTCG